MRYTQTLMACALVGLLGCASSSPEASRENENSTSALSKSEPSEGVIVAAAAWQPKGVTFVPPAATGHTPCDSYRDCDGNSVCAADHFCRPGCDCRECCPDGMSCTGGDSSPPPGVPVPGACVQSCAADAECPAGQRCLNGGCT